MSLRRQFVLVFVAFSLLVTVAGGLLAYRTASNALEQELDDKLIQVAGAAAEVGFSANLILSFRPGDEEAFSNEFTAVRRRLLGLKRFVDEAYILTPDLKAKVTTRSVDSVRIGDTLWELAPFQDDIQEAATNETATSDLFHYEPEDRYYKYGFVRLEHTDAILAVLMSANYMAPLAAFQRTAIVGSVLAAAVAALIAWLLAITVTRPVDRLGRVALRIQRGRMNDPVRQERGGELGRLSRAMERMREGILNRDEQLRLMLAQVAHEIRNPLGGLELFASAAADTEDAEERDRLIQRLRSEISALNKIIDDFLAFARPLRADAVLHDIRGPVREAVDLASMETKGEGHDFELDLPAFPLMARADPEHVKRVTLNLVRNAAQAGTKVRVRGESYRGEVVIFVRDDGPGVKEALKDRIFEPFVTDKEQGAGLGLAIVKRVVEANRGRVELMQGDGAGAIGAEFRVYFQGVEDITPEDSRT